MPQNNASISNGANGIGLPPGFTEFRPLSPFGERLSLVANRPDELPSFLWGFREEIGHAREAAFNAVRDSKHITIRGEASARYRLQRALANELGIPEEKVKLLSPLPPYLEELPPGHKRVDPGSVPEAVSEAAPGRVN